MDIREKFIEMKTGAERALAKYPYMAMKDILTAVLGKMVETGKLNVIFDAVIWSIWKLRRFVRRDCSDGAFLRAKS